MTLTSKQILTTGMSALNTLWTMMTGQRHSLTDPEMLELKANVRFNVDQMGRPAYNLAIRYRPLEALFEATGLTRIIPGFHKLSLYCQKTVDALGE